MEGIISRPKFVEEIKLALKREPAFLKIGEYEEDQFKQHCFSVSQVALEMLVIDIGVTDGSSLITGIKSIRATKPSIRIVLLAIDKEIGDKTVAAIVSLGITDVIPLSTTPIDEKGKERENFTPIIKRNIERTTTYADVVRWHYEVGDEFDPVNKNEKTKVKTKKQLVEKKVYETITEIIPVTTKNIGVFSLSENAGSSFVTMNLAVALSDYDLDVSVIEPPINPYFFDTLLLDSHEKEERSYVSVPHEIHLNEEKKHEFDNKFFNVYWNVADTRLKLIEEWKLDELLKQIYYFKTTLNIIDFGTYEIQGAYDYMDYIFLIIDPQPQAIFKNIERLMYFIGLKEKGYPVHLIYNKMNPGVDEKFLDDNLELDISGKVPHLDPMITYSCYFDGRIPYEHKGIEELFIDEIDEIVTKIIGKSHKKKPKEKVGLLKRLLNK